MGNSNIIWSAKDAINATGGTCSGTWNATGVSIDTRTIQNGDLFVALLGDAGDGHEYVAKAIENGAIAAVVAREVEGVPLEKLLIVDDTLKAMENLGSAARERSAAKIIGVTGSVGKTGTKEIYYKRISLSTFHLQIYI